MSLNVGDILVDADFGMSVTLIERYYDEHRKQFSWKMLVNSNSKGYNESKVGDIIISGEKYLEDWFSPYRVGVSHDG